MTLRELVKKAVEGLSKDFYSEKDRERLVEYILTNSTLSISKDSVELYPYNLFGVGEENKDKELPYFLDFVLFSWFKTNEQEEFLGYNRKWKLQSFFTLEELEDCLASSSDKGEYVILVEECIQPFKIASGFNPFCKTEIEWENIKPYILSYVADKTRIEERFNSKTAVEKRILELYVENGERVEGKYNYITIENSVDDREYGYTLTGRTHIKDINGVKEEKEPTFMWHTGYYAFDI